jgi:signal transduction histidine kinase
LASALLRERALAAGACSPPPSVVSFLVPPPLLTPPDPLFADKAKLAFVSQISHELRTPLHGVAVSFLLFLLFSAHELMGSPRPPESAGTHPRVFLPSPTPPTRAFSPRSSPLHTPLIIPSILPQTPMLDVADICLESLRDVLDDTLDYAKFSNSNPDTEAAQRSALTRHDLAQLAEDVTKATWVRKRRTDLASVDYHGPGRGMPSPAISNVDVVLEVEERRDGWTAWIDVGGMKRVLLNLLGNSLKVGLGLGVWVELEWRYGGDADCHLISSHTVHG